MLNVFFFSSFLEYRIEILSRNKCCSFSHIFIFTLCVSFLLFPFHALVWVNRTHEQRAEWNYNRAIFVENNDEKKRNNITHKLNEDTLSFTSIRIFANENDRNQATHCHVRTNEWTNWRRKKEREREKKVATTNEWLRVVLFALIMNLTKSSRLHANKLKLEFVQSPLVSYDDSFLLFFRCVSFVRRRSTATSYPCTRSIHTHTAP